MTRMQASFLPDGKRLHLSDGPIDLIVGADGDEAEVSRAYDAATARFSMILDELCAELPLLRQPTDRLPEGAVARRMWRATVGFASNTFITPMAAVAGSVAEEVLYAMVTAAEIERGHVNNGGDIAIHLVPWKEYRVGLVDRPDNPSLFAHSLVRWTDAARGIATSGWRGRSFSFGIADAVAVLAATASAADAAATLIANAVDLPGHPAITRAPANELQSDSDLGSRPVTTAVGHLTPQEIEAALNSGAVVASAMLASGDIIASALHLAGETRIVGNIPLQHERRMSANA